MEELLSYQIKSFQSGTTSITIEDAETVLKSILFVLVYDPQPGADPSRFSSLRARYDFKKKCLAGDLAKLEGFYQKVTESMLPLEIDSYQETIMAIGSFFKDYDLEFGAHEAGVDFDYLLSEPIDDQKFRGIFFVKAYLESLYFENLFCAKFSLRKIREVLTEYQNFLKFDPKTDINNIFDLIFTQAMGKKIIASSLASLRMNSLEIEYLQSILSLNKRNDLEMIGQKALTELIKDLPLDSKKYYYSSYKRFLTRLKRALSKNRLDLFFIVAAVQNEQPITLQPGHGLSDQEFGKVIEVISRLEEKQAASFVRSQFKSMLDYIDLFEIDLLNDQQLEQIIRSLDIYELAILIKLIFTNDRAGTSSLDIVLQDKTLYPEKWQQKILRCLSDLDSVKRSSLNKYLQRIRIETERFL